LVLRPEDMHFASLPLRQWDWPETVRVVVHNEGESPADSVWLELFLGDPQAQGSSIGSAVVPVMAGASQDTCWVPWATPPAEAEVFLYAFLDRADRIREENETNNLAVRKIQVLADSVAPVVWLGTEDSLSATGDYLAPGTTILGVVTDSLSAPDPTSLEVSLDGTVLDESDYNLSWQGTQRLVAALQVGEAPGTHSVRLRASDIAGNWCDPVAFAYVVSHELSLRNVYPFPSPATDWTEFTFLVSHPASATIDLFSLSGRPVRRLRAEVEPPIARLPWDLRDEDGDRVAAGVYLYVLRVFGETGAHRRHEGRVVVGGR
jgi:hypothetical protein